MRPVRATAAALTAFALGAFTLAGCGVPTGEGSYDEIEPANVPFGLNLAATTTTTSTTTTTTTVAPAIPVTTIEQTTTTIALEPVEIYFLSRGELQPVTVDLPRDYGRNQLVSQLEEGPPLGSAGVGLDTLIEPGLITDTEEFGGIITVMLDGDVFDEIEVREQRRAIGQIVLTFTGNLRGVGQVSFLLDGDPLGVQKGNGLYAEPGQPVSFDDYRELLADAPTTTTSTTSTSTSTSTSTVPDTAAADLLDE
ncbi:MAG: GerMN domain-containing protein [Acidimicrobiia bacterium]|nr:GerMN domain-containing protein [Acidimicrobiia bacterium]